MRKDIFLTLTISLLLLTVPLYGSNGAFCGTDELLEAAIEENPAILEEIELFDQKAASATPTASKRGEPDYIIPVVFHIIHDNGIENIDRTQIVSALNQVNEDFRLINEDTSQIIPEFRDVAADTRIELRLATIDPDGNPVNGINRIQSELTYDANSNENNVMELEMWDRTRYFNIYVVSNITSPAGSRVLGYAYFPFMSEDGADGMVIRHDYLGKVGTAEGNTNRTFTHEVGHYLGLFHTFQGGCPSNPNFNCNSYGDRVCDTPPQDEAHQACNTSYSSCGNLNNIQNHMDYSNCRVMFTEGQRQRMHQVLENTIRASLVTSQNLQNTGALVPLADFEVNKTRICENIPVQFTQITANAGSFDESVTYEWILEGTEEGTSNQKEPEVTYNTPGTFDVKLIVKNDWSADTVLKENLIHVYPEVSNYSTPYAETFSDETFSSEEWLTFSNIDFPANWEKTGEAGISDNASLYFNVFDIDLPRSSFSFLTPPINISEAEEPTLEFNYAFANVSTGNTNEMLQIRSYNTCTQSEWLMETLRFGDLLTVNDAVPNAFFPNNEEQWKTLTSRLHHLSDETNIKFRFTITTSGNGNNMFIDNIRVFDDALTSISKSSLPEHNLLIYPNPSHDRYNVTFTTETSIATIRVTDVTGRTLSSMEYNTVHGENTLELEASELNLRSAGLYWLEVITENKRMIKKIGYQPH